jgi:hypothetical protein
VGVDERWAQPVRRVRLREATKKAESVMQDDPTYDICHQRKKGFRVYVRRDLRDRIHVVTPSTLNAWVIGGAKPATSKGL